MSGCTPMSPKLYSSDRIRTNSGSTFLAHSHEADSRDPCRASSRRRISSSSHVSVGLSPTETMRSPGRMPAFCSRGTRRDHADDGRAVEIQRHLAALRQHHSENEHRQQQVHHRSHDEHLESLPLRLRQELVGRAGPGLVRRFARHLHVAAERQRADAVFRVAALELQQLRPEPERERQHTDADAARRKKVPQLVHEHEHAEDDDETPGRV